MHPCTQRRTRLARATRVGAALALSLVLIAISTHAHAQTRTLSGRVLTDAGAPAAGVTVRIDGTAHSATTDERGTFRFDVVPAGELVLTVNQIGWKPVRHVVRPGTVVELRLEARALLLDEVVVTTAREEQRRAETAATVNSVSGTEIERVKASHPSELLNRLPGVWVNVTGGEGHMAAIRQPMTTNPVYLYLENGVPTRSTGFFNHNAMYEVDLPHAGRIEVVKGPATALYGSDAIGGLVNVLSRSAADSPPLSLAVEGGAFGFGRVLASGRAGGLMGELNVTRTDGWRTGTDYDRQSGTLRWERTRGASSLRTMVTYSRIDQNTAGTSAITETDYHGAPRNNYTPISYRQVQALRASAAWERLSGSTLVSVTPFARWNTMEMLPNWTLTFDPHISRTGHASAGALIKVRRDMTPLRLRAVGGLDLDYSPGRHREWQIQVTRTDRVFTDFTRGAAIYDYDVAFHSVSPYVQLEASPLQQVRLVAGLRYDMLGYDYDNPLGELQTGSHRRPASTSVRYDHLSPKLGAIWAPADEFRIFGSYGHGFRTPSEGQLFRQGRALSTVGLRPVRADNLEAGIGGTIAARLSYEVSAYHMRKHDDLLTFTRPDGSTETVNAGETLHRGVEVGAALALPFDVRAHVAFSNARHTYETWTPATGTDYSGNTMETAPNRTASAGVTWSPRRWQSASVGIEAQHVGSYWMDAPNTTRYDGHTLLSLRAEAPVTGRVAIHGRITNLLDTRYAELAQYTVARGSEYAPGLPRALYVGVRYR